MIKDQMWFYQMVNKMKIVPKDDRNIVLNDDWLGKRALEFYRVYFDSEVKPLDDYRGNYVGDWIDILDKDFEELNSGELANIKQNIRNSLNEGIDVFREELDNDVLYYIRNEVEDEFYLLKASV